jgi:hypothetical protein
MIELIFDTIRDRLFSPKDTAIRRLEMGARTLSSAVAAIALLTGASAITTGARAAMGDDFVEEWIGREVGKLIGECIDADCLRNPNASVGSWTVTGLMPGQALNMFNGPVPNRTIVGQIPAGGGGIRILDCLTGAGSRQPEWCRVRYGRQEGWVSFQYLVRER